MLLHKRISDLRNATETLSFDVDYILDESTNIITVKDFDVFMCTDGETWVQVMDKVTARELFDDSAENLIMRYIRENLNLNVQVAS